MKRYSESSRIERDCLSFRCNERHLIYVLTVRVRERERENSLDVCNLVKFSRIGIAASCFPSPVFPCLSTESEMSVARVAATSNYYCSNIFNELYT